MEKANAGADASAVGSMRGRSPRTAAEKRGRVSGSAAWRSQRGELGTGEAKRLALVAEEEGDTAASATTSSASRLKARVQELFAENIASGMSANEAAVQALATAKAEAR